MDKSEYRKPLLTSRAAVIGVAEIQVSAYYKGLLVLAICWRK